MSWPSPQTIIPGNRLYQRSAGTIGFESNQAANPVRSVTLISLSRMRVSRWRRRRSGKSTRCRGGMLGAAVKTGDEGFGDGFGSGCVGRLNEFFTQST